MKTTAVVLVMALALLAPAPTEANVFTSFLGNVLAPIGNVALEIVGTVFPEAEGVLNVVKGAASMIGKVAGIAPETTFAEKTHQLAGVVKDRKAGSSGVKAHPKDTTKNMKEKVGLSGSEVVAIAKSILMDFLREEEETESYFAQIVDQLGDGLMTYEEDLEDDQM